MSARVKNMFLMKTDTINTPEIILVKGKNIRCTLKPLLYIGLTREKQKTLFTECCNSFIIIRNKSLKKQKVRDQVLQLKNTSPTVRDFSLCRNLHWKADACCHILPLFSNLMACFTCKYYSFQLLNSVKIFFFNDAPNVVTWWKVWTAGRSVHHRDSSTVSPCCCTQ